MADGKELQKVANNYLEARKPKPKWNGMLKLDAFNSQESEVPAPVNAPAPAPVQGLELSPDAEGPALDREGRMREMMKALKAGQAKRKAQGGL